MLDLCGLRGNISPPFKGWSYPDGNWNKNGRYNVVLVLSLIRTSPVSFWFNSIPNLCKTTYISIKLDRVSKLTINLRFFFSCLQMTTFWLPGWLWPEVDGAQQSGWRKKIKYIHLIWLLPGWLWPEVDFSTHSAGGIFFWVGILLFCYLGSNAKFLNPTTIFENTPLVPQIYHSAGGRRAPQNVSASWNPSIFVS